MQQGCWPVWQCIFCIQHRQCMHFCSLTFMWYFCSSFSREASLFPGFFIILPKFWTTGSDRIFFHPHEEETDVWNSKMAYPPTKVQVVLEALKGQLTTVELTSKYGVYAGQIMTWKNRASGVTRSLLPCPQAIREGSASFDR